MATQGPAGQTTIDSPAASSKSYSCVICYQRKVKCDRQDPCSNCAKSRAECVYRPPPPPRRRKRGRGNESVPHGHRNKSRRRDSETRSAQQDAGGILPTAQPRPTRKAASSAVMDGNGPGRMITREGNSVYLDSVSHELPDAADVLDNASESDTDTFTPGAADDTMMILSPASRECLTELHPQPLHIFKLWQTFLENVNPLTKIIHTPTVQQQILEAMSDLSRVGKDLEALMFSIYCISLVSLPAGDVEKSFGESKASLLSKYRRGAQLALRNASFLRTSSVVVLQAFIFYLLMKRALSDRHTVWTLCGIALRIAQRIGLHRDGSRFGLSIFETEMRRRIWLQLIILDSTSAQFSGVSPSPFLSSADVQPPANANDSDLDPRMTEPPSDKDGPTEMIFCKARCQFGKWVRRYAKDTENDWSWGILSSSSKSIEEKDRIIDELDGIIEKSILRHCDRSIPLHLLATLMMRSASAFTRLMAHHPRQYQDGSNSMPESEKDIVFENCLKMAEYCDQSQTNPSIQGFHWHMENHVPWDAIIIMLSEMRHRRSPEEKSKAWQLIANIYTRLRRNLRKKSQTPLHLAIQNLMVKAWRAYIEECNSHRRTPTSCPTIVAEFLASAEDRSEPNAVQSGPVVIEQDAAFSGQPDPNFAASSTGLEADDFGFFLGNSPEDWNDWDSLLNQFNESMMDAPFMSDLG
ncbi:hypothetical protein N7474_005889 [Penicillium riverlandense]|uniref:uncharacterized protein n=1 Tax=Penicillium riverlandense TaxID=1903569 RepID=UPI00254791B4|nr:uncharacterized protein N7474_005889 [Penicillium riverlandense]KAJ5820298.1 hypothetical protein N7474_005889 [Penicillium riverlandense]